MGVLGIAIVSGGVPFAVLRRTWALDATWHPERMQCLSVVHALAPVLRAQDDVAAAGARHTTTFNCNLWMAPAVIAAMARLESEGSGDGAVRIRDVLAPPLSGMGDAHVWKAIRPACLVLAVAGVMAGASIAAVAAACALYAGAAVRQVWRGYRHGIAFGADLSRHIDAVRPPEGASRAARRLCGLAAGALLGYGLVRALHTAPAAVFLLSAALVVGYTAAKRQLSPGFVFLLLVIVAAVLPLAAAPAGSP